MWERRGDELVAAAPDFCVGGRQHARQEPLGFTDALDFHRDRIEGLIDSLDVLRDFLERPAAQTFSARSDQE